MALTVDEQQEVDEFESMLKHIKQRAYLCTIACLVSGGLSILIGLLPPLNWASGACFASGVGLIAIGLARMRDD